MPKSHIRCKHMGRGGRSCSNSASVQSDSTNDYLLLSTSPRKVSFEDNRIDSNPSICSDDTVPTKNNGKKIVNETSGSGKQNRRAFRRKRSLLVRPITSLSLVDLARSVTHDDVSPLNKQIEEGDSKKLPSFNLSPCSVMAASTDLSDMGQQNFSSLHTQSEATSKSIQASPWGYFVDMAPDEYDRDSLSVGTQPDCHSTSRSIQKRISRCPCKESISRIRRRSGPYGKYKTYTTREYHPTLNFIVNRTDSKGKSGFRLSPRKNDRHNASTDDLIGVFSDLQVQRVQQNMF